MRQNLLLSASDLKIGDTIIIPGAIKVIPKPVVAPAAQAVAKSSGSAGATPTASYSAPAAKSEYVAPSGSYTLTWRAPQHTFYWGNCTWYVAQYKNVNWGGNANRWLANASAKGHATGTTASV
jgi:surface antigen